jgi:hypothetical protein
MKKINIEFSGNIIEAELNDTDTAKKILDALPIEGVISRWGEEIYFSIPVDGSLEDGIEVLEVGDIAFWPPGNAFCIFFGPTPVSTDERPRAAGPVTVIGNILDKKDVEVLKLGSDGQAINLT